MIVKAHKEIDDRGLSASSRSYDSNSFTPLGMDIYAVKYLLCLGVAEAHVLHFDISLCTREDDSILPVRGLGGLVKQSKYALGGRGSLLYFAQNICKLVDRTEEFA